MLKIIKRYKYIITLVLILLIILLCILRKNSLKENNIEYSIYENEAVAIEDTNDIIKEETLIKVDIKGQVNSPGVYELKLGSRVIDAINLAGGLTDIANTSLINLSKKLEDQMVIIIYSEEEVLNSNIKEVETVFKVIEKECVCPNIKNDSCINTELDNNETDKEENISSSEDNIDIININTATLEELMKLPSIGEAKAQAIIEYRNENKFISVEDIKNVSGIGEALFDKIKAYITI